MRSVLSVHWKDWCWCWNSSTLATSCRGLTHWKRPWYWEGLGAGGEGDNRGWDDWLASPTRWTWVWVNSGSWWWTGTPGLLRLMGSQRSDMTIRLKWTDWLTLGVSFSNSSYFSFFVHFMHVYTPAHPPTLHPLSHVYWKYIIAVEGKGSVWWNEKCFRS